MCFGKFLSGQNLGNYVSVSNKSKLEQTFSLDIASKPDTFKESAKQLLAPFNSEDLPFQTHKSNDLAENSQSKFNCWSIENPSSKTLSKQIVFTLGPKETKDFVVVLQTPMTVSQRDLFAKLVLTHVPETTAQSIVEKRIGANFNLLSKPLEVTHSLSVLLCGRL